jgi:hypothetical protein
MMRNEMTLIPIRIGMAWIRRRRTYVAIQCSARLSMRPGFAGVLGSGVDGTARAVAVATARAQSLQSDR